MQRFQGMMPRDEIAREEHFKDKDGRHITVQAGPNGWSVLWSDHSSSYKDITQTADANWQAAMAYLDRQGFPAVQLTPVQPMGER